MTSDAVVATHPEDERLKRCLDFRHLVAAEFSGVISSGWLVGDLYAAHTARARRCPGLGHRRLGVPGDRRGDGGSYAQALSAAGIVYAYTGFQTPPDLSGEARDSHRDMPRAILTGLRPSIVLHIGLQVAFIAAMPGSRLASQFLLPTWRKIIAATSKLRLFVYSVTTVRQAPPRSVEPSGKRRAARSLAPIGYMLATLVPYWVKWSNLRIVPPLLIVAVVVYAWNTWGARHSREQVHIDLRAGTWLLAYVAAVPLLSGPGAFGDRSLIHTPWNSVVVGALGVVG